MSTSAAGMDLSAALDAPLIIEPGQRCAVATGWAMQIPEGYEAQVRPRSGLAIKHGITMINAPGTIDADYRGEVKVLVVNHGDVPFTVEPGLRIAQLVVAPVVQVEVLEVDVLDDSERGDGGFGSTGTSV
jgi:dUTP pyrophosphatase